MALTEARTLQITATAQDFLSKQTTRMGRAIDQLESKVVGRFKSMLKSVFSFRTGFIAIAAGFAGIRGVQAIEETLSNVDKLAKTARSFGTPIDQINDLKTAFEMAGFAADEFGTILKQISVAQAHALDSPASKQAKAFRQLGLSVEDLKSLNVVQLLDRISKGLEKFGTNQEKNAALVQLLPKGAAKLINLLGVGQDAFRDMIVTARRFGGTLDEEAGKAAERWDDALTILKAAATGIGRDTVLQIARELSPAAEKLAEFLADNGKSISNTLAKLAVGLIRFAGAVGAGFLKLVAFLQTNSGKLIEALEGIPIIGGKIADSLREAFDVEKLTPAQQQLRDQIQQTADALVSLQNATAPKDGGVADQEGFLKSQQAECEKLKQDLDDLVLKYQELAAKSGSVQPIKAGQGVKQDALDAASTKVAAAEISAAMKAAFSEAAGPDRKGLLRIAMFGEDGSAAPVEAETVTFFQGFSDEIQKTTSDWMDMGQAGVEAAQMLSRDGLDGLVDGLADIATRTKSAKEAFRDYAKALLSDLAKIASKLLIIKLLETIGLGAAQEKGGVLPGEVMQTRRIQKFEQGGIARQPTLAVFGEGRNKGKGEAFVPLPDGRRIPVNLKGSMASSTNITIYAMDSKDVTRALLKQRPLLSGLWRADVESRHKSRQAVRQAAS